MNIPKWSYGPKAQLFGTGFLQVFFVGANTAFISHYALIGNLLTAFAISWIWTHNVKKVAFGDEKDRMAYAVGAALGSVTGTVTANRALNLMNGV